MSRVIVYLQGMAATQTTGTGQLRDAYRRVMDRINTAAQRSGRRAEDILVVAVTKTASPDQIRTLVEMGQIYLGENRVQHLAQRVAQLNEFLNRKRMLGRATAQADEPVPEPRWHMVGNLQRNKAKEVIPLVKLIHSVNSLRLAEEIQQAAARMDRIVEVLLEVNMSGESSKQGVTVAAVGHLAEQLDTMVNVKLRGMMVMGPLVDDPERTRSVFARTREIYEDIRTEGLCGEQFNVLSMGMTNDFEIAIEEGANLLRIGRAFFDEG